MYAEVTGKGPGGLWEETHETETRFLTLEPDALQGQCQLSWRLNHCEPPLTSLCNGIAVIPNS